MTTNENLRRKIRLSELAQVANLSLSRFSHLFKSEIGLSPGQYLLGLRMEKARHLLASTRLSIKEVMAQAGYDNRSHFIRHFSRFFGAVPQKYRKRAQSR
jgi:AraC family transcriptional regulator